MAAPSYTQFPMAAGNNTAATWNSTISEIGENFVASGMEVTGNGTTTLSIAAGVVYISGIRYNLGAGTTTTYTIDNTNYVFYVGTGTLDYACNTTNATIAVSVRLASFITTGTTISGIIDLRTSQPRVRQGVRISSIRSSATPTPNADITDQFNITALAAGATFGSPTGTLQDAQRLVIRIKDNGTARALAWNGVYRASSNLDLPITTVISKTMYCGFIYNLADTKWDFIAFLEDF